MDDVYSGGVGKIMSKMGLMPARDKLQTLRIAATVTCDSGIPVVPCEPLQAPCLFNVEDDPCERVNMANKEPQILKILLEELRKVNQTAVPPNNKKDDARGDPKFWGRVYTNFGDYKMGDASALCL